MGEEIATDIPIWLVRQRFRKYGASLPARTLLDTKPKCTKCGEIVHIEGSKLCGKCKWESEEKTRAAARAAQRDSRREDSITGFDNSEFRYWIASHLHWNKDEAVCRNCYVRTTGGARGRKAHFEAQKTADTCGRILTNAYLKLMPTRRCVVCRIETSNTEWGIPFCLNPVCMTTWKFDSTRHYLLLDMAIKGKLDKVK